MQETGRKIDARCRALAGEPTWIRSNVEIFEHGSTLNSHDWIQLIQSAGAYILAGLYPDKPQRMKAITALLDACSKCLVMNSAADSDNRDDMDKLKLEVTVALCKCEAQMPKTEMAVMFHVLLHVPDAIYKWNNVRNFWSFFGERSTHFVICRQAMIVLFTNHTFVDILFTLYTSYVDCF
jgi:hypothetical protein